MQITATTSIQPIAAAAHSQGQDAEAQKAATLAAAPKVFTPAPPLRPNIQDFVDIDRTLITLSSV